MLDSIEVMLDYPSVIRFLNELHQSQIMQRHEKKMSTNLPILFVLLIYPIGSMYGIYGTFTYIWLIFMVNV